MRPARFLCPWDPPAKNTGAGCHALHQGIFRRSDQTCVSCIAGRFFTIWTTREAWTQGRISVNTVLSWHTGFLLHASGITAFAGIVWQHAGAMKCDSMLVQWNVHRNASLLWGLWLHASLVHGWTKQFLDLTKERNAPQELRALCSSCWGKALMRTGSGSLWGALHSLLRQIF